MNRLGVIVTAVGIALSSACTPVMALGAVTPSGELSSLPIKGRAPMTGYSRDQFKHWIDADKDFCDTRSEILERDALPGTEHRNSKGCVDGAQVRDPYSGKIVTEAPGAGSLVDIDHVVALGNTWQTGAQQLSATQRQALANDPLNLLAVDRSLNRQKGDGDAATWLPPLKSGRCNYVTRQVQVKVKYKLWVTQAEHDAIARNCP
jgi:hypothetical protein